MKIGIDTSRANFFPRSGVEWYAFNLLKKFYELGQSDDFLLYTPDNLVSDLLPLPKNFQQKVLKWPFSKFWTLGRMSLEMSWRKPDILFVPSHTFPFVGGKKNVITWHDVAYERYPENYSRWELTSLKQGIKRSLRMADKIIAISNFTKEEMLRIYDVDPGLIEVVHLGCDHKVWHPVDPSQYKKVLESYNVTFPYFVFLGKLSMKKNVIGLIRIYNYFRSKAKEKFNLILIGSESPFNKEIDNEIKASPYRDEIRKFGWLPTADIPAFLSGAKALIFPSIYEGFGLPALEAMASGCPVIASNSTSLPEILGEAGLYSNTHDIEGFAGQMAKITEDQGLRQNLIKLGLARAEQFSWDKAAEKTLKIFHSI